MFELRTLGRLELARASDGAIPMQAKRLALLAYLAALPPHGFRRRDTLLLLFWPDLDQEHARGALRQGLHSLRKTLGEGAILTRGEDEIGLESAQIRSDAKALEEALSAGDPETAISLYRGDFLDGVFVSEAAPELEDWISAERTRLRGLAAKAAWMVSELPANREKVGDLVRRAVQWSGDDEAALRRGLRILDGMGDRAGAAALYDDFARRVARDFDVDLSAETRGVIRELRARRASGRHQSQDADPIAPAAIPTAVPTVALPAEPVRRPGKKLLLAAAAGALLVLALASIGPRGGTPRQQGAAPVVVMPFRVSEADSALAWLSDGIVELLAVRLVGAGSTIDGRQVEGSITGSKDHLILSTSLSPVVEGAAPGRATVEGPVDSLPQMADRLAAQLLGLSAGIEGERLASLANASLPAVRLFLRGLEISRRADMDAALRLYSEAVEQDSTFTVAGLEVCRSAFWAPTLEHAVRGCQVARRGRDRLSPGDRALLDANPPQWATAAEQFTMLNAAVVAFPERAENWYALGDAHYRNGRLVGEEGWAERATEVYRRGWLLDSAAVTAALGTPPLAEPMLQLVELAQMRYDTAEVIRLTESVFAVDSTSDLSRILRWHRALVTDTSARAAFWDDIGSAGQKVTMFIILFTAWTGIGTEDYYRARDVDQAYLRAHNPGFASFAFAIEALNGGRPGEIRPQGPAHDKGGNNVHRVQIQRALSWDGDTAAALESVQILSRSLDAPASGERARQQLFNNCIVGEWHAAHGDYAGAAKAVTRLRQARIDSSITDPGKTARYVSFCTTLLDAMLASGLRQPDAREKVAVADSVARDFIYVICCGERLGDANIQIAHLWEREGNPQAALRAIDRGAERFRWAPVYMSTLLREEGRLSALTGDTVRAISAYRRYLEFRNDPQASLKPAADSVRRELALLMERK